MGFFGAFVFRSSIFSHNFENLKDTFSPMAATTKWPNARELFQMLFATCSQGENGDQLENVGPTFLKFFPFDFR